MAIDPDFAKLWANAYSWNGFLPMICRERRYLKCGAATRLDLMNEETLFFALRDKLPHPFITHRRRCGQHHIVGTTARHQSDTPSAHEGDAQRLDIPFGPIHFLLLNISVS